MTYILPTRLTVHDIASISAGAPVSVSERALEEIDRCHLAANGIAEAQPVYGRSTGVGANRLTSTATDSATHGMNLLRSHAVDAGPVVDSATTRAMLAVRLNQLLRPGSGIEPSVVEGLARMLDSGALPEVRRFGGVGTADLPALAGVALALAGERETTGGAFEPIGDIRSDSALPFMSSSALTIAGAALAAARLDRLVHAGLAAFALSALGSRANPEAFSTRAATAIGSPTSLRNAETIEAILGDADWEPMRIQDPFAYRGFLPSISVLTCAVDRLREAAETLADRAQENPRFFADPELAVHHGAFLENWLAHELDSTAIALGQAAPQTIGRIRFLNDDAVSGLPRFLAPDLGGRSGTMIVEYLAASAMGEVFASTGAVSTQSAVLSCGVEEDATFAPSALAKLERALDGYEIMIACEIVVARRALRLRGTDAEKSSARAGLLALTEALPAELEDRDLRGDIEIARGLIPGLAEVAGLEAGSAR